MVRSEGNMSLKNPVTPSGIDQGTIQLRAQHLNHYATPDPSSVLYYPIIHYTITESLLSKIQLQQYINF
jgi:hypothetical protein